MTNKTQIYYRYEPDENGVFSLKEKHLTAPQTNCFTTKKDATRHFMATQERAIKKYNVIIDGFNRLRKKFPNDSVPTKKQNVGFYMNDYEFKFPMEFERNPECGFLYKRL